MKLHKIFHTPNGKIDWRRSWKSAKDFLPKNLVNAKLRELFPYEIVLDYESEEEAIIGRKLLKKNKVSHETFKTNSRGQHVHIKIPKLSVLDEMKRRFYREVMIQEYGSDPSKKSGFIAMPYRLHFKSGKMKSLIERFEIGENELNMTYLIKANRLWGEFNQEKSCNTEFNKSLLRTAKKLGFKEMGRKGNEVFGYFENSAGKSHFWINTKKKVFYDFHTNIGGGLVTMVATMMKGSWQEAAEWLSKD